MFGSRLSRDFDEHADDKVLEAVENATAAAESSTATAMTTASSAAAPVLPTAQAARKWQCH